MLPVARKCCRGRPASTARRLFLSAQRRYNSDDRTPIKHGTPPNGAFSVDGAAPIEGENQPKPDHAVVLSGIQPTEEPHLGNYLGAMKNWKRLQDLATSDDKLLFSIVDLHAITIPQDPEALRVRKLRMLASLIAVGLDPEKSTLFYQSSVPQHSELMWILSCSSSFGYLSRMTQFKSKLMQDNKQGDLERQMDSKLKLGLFSYPVLQAADILVHRATYVPVGSDQKQHLEFARECVTNFNHTYQTDALIPPETLVSPAPRIMSLTDPTVKMSKSATNPRSRIPLSAPPSEVERRIMGAKTDSLFTTVNYDRENRPGVANLLEIIASCGHPRRPTLTTPEDVAAYMQSASLLDLKQLAVEAVNKELKGYRDEYHKALHKQGGDYLREVEAYGAETARKSAEETMRLVRHAVGLA